MWEHQIKDFAAMLPTTADMFRTMNQKSHMHQIMQRSFENINDRCNLFPLHAIGHINYMHM